MTTQEQYIKYNFFVALLSNKKVSLTEKQIILKGMVTNQGVIQKFFLGGVGWGDSSMKNCDHECDEALIKNSWGSVKSIHILVS